MEIILLLGTGAEVAAIAGVVAGLASAGAGVAQQQASRRASRRNEQAQQVSAVTQSQQIRAAADEQRERQRAQLAQAQGRATVLAVEAGTSEGLGTLVTDQLLRVSERDTALVGTNSALQQGAVATGAQANIAQISAQRVNPLIAAFASVVQGVQTGTQTQRAVTNIVGPSQPPPQQNPLADSGNDSANNTSASPFAQR